MKYESYSYIWPPRPKNAAPPSAIKIWDNGLMFGEPKLNGSNCTIYTNGIQVKAMNRHNQSITNYRLDTSEIFELFRSHSKGEWMVINGEYLNKSKNDETGKTFNHKLVIFDLLVLNSNYLVGKTFQERIDIRHNLFGTLDSEKSYLYKITENIYHVKSYTNGFNNLFNTISKIDMVEGLVLKRKNARLEMGLSESNNTKSQIKIRKSTRNYKF